ncbi:MAG: CapA family protein [bacterium]
MKINFKVFFFSVFFVTIISCIIFLHRAKAENNKPEVTLLAAGDILFDSEIEDIIKSKGGRNIFEKVAPILKQGDIVFGNLESMMGTKKGVPIYKDLKPYNFLASLDRHKILKENGFNVLNLANNHTMDYGPGPIRETRQLLLKEGMHFFGAGQNLNEARGPAIIIIKGIKFAFLGYSKTYPQDGYASENKAGIAPINLDYIREDIKNIRGKSDFVIVSIHWGTEYKFMPDERQKEIAHKTIDSGADMILGHHPHVLQGIEIYKNKFIIYSLGNFLFDQENYWKDKSIILSCNFSKDRLKSIKIIPIDRYEKYLPKPAEGNEKNIILNKIKQISLPLNSGTDIFKNSGLF